MTSAVSFAGSSMSPADAAESHEPREIGQIKLEEERGHEHGHHAARDDERPGAGAVLRFATHERERKQLAEHALAHPDSRLEAVAPDKATHAVIEVKGCAGLPDAELAYAALTLE